MKRSQQLAAGTAAPPCSMTRIRKMHTLVIRDIGYPARKQYSTVFKAGCQYFTVAKHTTRSRAEWFRRQLCEALRTVILSSNTKSAARRPRKERMSTPDTSRPSGTLEFLYSAPDFIAWLNSPESREKHRDQYNDLEWASQQPKGAPKYKVGDVVEFHAGGYGVIREVAQPHSGWPSSYATKDVEGYPPHAARKFAWHYEGDFKTLVAKSPLHSLPNSAPHGRDERSVP